MNWINNKVYKATFKNVILFLLLLGFTGALEAKADYEKTKTITKEFKVNENSIVELIHDRGLVDVIYHDGPLAKVETNIVVRGSDEGDLEKLISKYTLEINNSNTKVNIKSNFNIEVWSSTTWFFAWGSHKVKFSDGDQINTKVESVKANLTLWLPNIAKFKLENQYDNVQIGDLPCDVEVILSSGNLDIGNLAGDLVLNLKYGNANLGNLKQANIDIFEGILSLKNGEDITLKSKYSDIKTENFASLNLDIFEGKISTGDIKTTMDIKGKYAEIKVKNMDRGNWDLFECNVELDNANQITLKGKYGNHNIKNIENLEVDLFETNLEIGTAGTIVCNADKYSNFKIDLLKSSFQSYSSFEGSLIVSKLNDSFTGIDVTGKYGNIVLPLRRIKSYQLDIESKYGQINYDESSLDISKLIEKDEEITLIAKSKNGGADSPMVKIRGFEMVFDVSN